ncbi:unnamed protein product [Adineta ricciae]|uniref:RHD domain-containing protein n=1 Tax=Adineta ricciae TaxID=249248 RepID=A0A814RV62_ADIRI|nr:unnamed protein product [Adineta ricciae]
MSAFTDLDEPWSPNPNPPEFVITELSQIDFAALTEILSSGELTGANSPNSSNLSGSTSEGVIAYESTGTNDPLNNSPLSLYSELQQSEPLEIIAQPNEEYRGRYKCENSPANRFIRTDPEKSPYQYPTIKIPKQWRSWNPWQRLYIRVTLVTERSGTGSNYYIHPYELTAVDGDVFQDPSQNNSLYFPVNEKEMLTGEKSFRLIVTKKKQEELKAHGALIPFGFEPSCQSHDETIQNVKQTIEFYQLGASKLAFMIAHRTDAISVPVFQWETLIFSTSMIDTTTSGSRSPARQFNDTRASPLIKCIPQKVDWRGNEEIVIILPQQPNRQKNYTITFDFTPHPLVVLNNVTHIDKRVFSFMAPQCPLPFTDQPRNFPMTIRENNVVIALVNFTYVPPISMMLSLCPACSQTTFVNQGNTASNKRQRGREDVDDVKFVNALTSGIARMGLEQKDSEASSSSESIPSATATTIATAATAATATTTATAATAATVTTTAATAATATTTATAATAATATTTATATATTATAATATTTATKTTTIKVTTAAARDDHAAKLDKYLDQLQEALVQFVQTNDPSRLFRRTRVLLSKCVDSPPPLHVAIERGHISLALTIIEQVASMREENDILERRNESGENVLLVGGRCNAWKVIEMLVKMRKDVIERVDNDGNNLLHKVGSVKDDAGAETIKNLFNIMSEEVKTNLLMQMNKNGETPARTAELHENTCCFELLSRN